MKFSIVMPIYNHAQNCERAILSILNQSYSDWELIMLDNASEDPNIAQLIDSYQKQDSRIQGFRIEENVGWPKGVSLCLEKASGIYMGFLAADDFLEADGLQNIVDDLGQNTPPIIWMGNKEDYEGTGKIFDICPPKQVYTSDLAICENLITFFQTVYYNAMHHFIDIKFLRKNNIDFFSPYYSDCGSMTRALSLAPNMIVLSQSPYHLVRGTSHSTGKYLVGSYNMFIGQYRDIQEKLFHTGYFSTDLLTYIAKRFETNHLSVIRNLCVGGACQNELFDTVILSWPERLIEFENNLASTELESIIYFYGQTDFFATLENSLLLLVNHALKDNCSIEDLIHGSNYLGDIILGLFNINNQIAEKKTSLDINDITHLFIAVLNNNNHLLFGYHYIDFLISNASQDIKALFEKALPAAKNKYATYLKNILTTSLNGYYNNKTNACVIGSCINAYSKHCALIIEELKKSGTNLKLAEELDFLSQALIKERPPHENN